MGEYVQGARRSRPRESGVPKATGMSEVKQPRERGHPPGQRKHEPRCTSFTPSQPLNGARRKIRRVKLKFCMPQAFKATNGREDQFQSAM